MSNWKALNYESDDESDIEVDDTKELQIEEALKLYQTALKFHAEGPASFDKAAAAYQELFESDIFKYPESQPELKRIELYGPLGDSEDELWQDGLDTGAVLPTGSLETGPSTLPQILHLSHKNYAQFRLEYLTAQLDTVNVTLKQILAEASAALNHFVHALDKDDADLDLWRKTAAVGGMLNSKRVARFCLEAVLDGDDEGLNGVLSLPGLEEGLAAEKLRELVIELQDRLSILQSNLSMSKRRTLSKMLRSRLSTFTEITQREGALLKLEGWPGQLSRQPERVLLKPPSTWAEMGDMLLGQLMAEQHGTSTTAPTTALGFDLNGTVNPAPLAVDPSVQRATTAPDSTNTYTEHTRMPKTISEQFPGLDHGKPTAQPQIASADPSMQLARVTTGSGASSAMESPTMTLPTRKRSSDTAGFQDGTEEGRTKSRRTRARDSNAEPADNRQALIDANTRWEYEQQLNEFQAADDWMFETVGNLFERIGVVGFERAKDVRQEINALANDEEVVDSESAADPLRSARFDILAFLNNFNDPLAQVLLNRGEDLGMGLGPTSAGLSGAVNSGKTSKVASKAPPMPEDGLIELLRSVNNGWLLTQEVAGEWLTRLLEPDRSGKASNSYVQYTWPETLKAMVARTLVNFDDHIYEESRTTLEELPMRSHGAKHNSREISAFAEMTLTIFELHLDIYTLIKEPNSGVESETIIAQADRLQRWSELGREAMKLRSFTKGDTQLTDPLNLRFLWATTSTVAAANDVSQDHVIECLNDLRSIFVAADEPVILLQNNAVMPELSIEALDKEISRLTTKDFFLRVTDQDVREPVAVIESLEPLLLALDDSDSSEDKQESMDPSESSAGTNVPQELVRFLQSSTLSVRLLLWQRLRDAYVDIKYQPMVVFCYFRMMRLLLGDLKLPATSGEPQPERQLAVVKTLRLLKEMIAKLFDIFHTSECPLECIDDAGLKSAVSTLGEVLQLVQVFNVCEDFVRVGQVQPPMQANGIRVESFDKVNKAMHEMQLQIWMILYGLLQEAIYQNSDQSQTLVEDKFDFLRCVHRNLGLRGICGGCNRAFVRRLKDEFVNMTHIEGYDSEQAQVLYDLYGLNCFLNPSYELIEHRCTHDAFLDRGVAMQAVDLLLAQASKLPIKELVKHSLRDTIEKVHGHVVRKKPSEAIQRNREVYRAFMRSPINPLDLFNCLKGDGNELPVSPIPKEDALLASKGWFFLMGHLYLAKFRSVKRSTPTATEDVELAIAFFNQDLEYSMENWETWFRLAQAYDTKIEESVVWSAEKLNSSMPDIVLLQRQAIHCYTLATALLHRSGDLALETSEKATELYADFAMRLYSSSREPFSMLPFAIDEVEKFLSMPSGMGKGKPFTPLRLYTAWKLAKVFFTRAIAGRPHSWTLHFALGKCMWKMFAAPAHVRRHDQPPSKESVIETFVKAINLIPDKRDSREKREPILEPHYKLVSIVHKMVSRGDLNLQEAREALHHTPYARLVTFPQDMDEWVPHVLAILKNLRAADKSNWHHRMIARAAHIVYDDSDPRAEGAASGGQLGAMGAKHELTQQMFTKTMVLNVWRPDIERAGRHFVYTARYTRFFVKILEQLKDRSGLEALARRVRRRPHEIFEHSLVWQEICNAYLRLLRSYAGLSEGLETSTFSNIAHEDFLTRKEPLEKWMQAQDEGTSAALDVLREVQELKKINQSLMKPGPIDDLIGDSYAYLFNTIGKQLWDDERRIKQEEEAQRPPPVASPPRNPMMSLTHLMNLDGSNDGASALPTAQAPPTAPTPAEQPAQRRKIGVGRREIRLCAESCAQKAMAVPAARATAASAAKAQVMIPNNPYLAAGDASVETSAPGSIHDSADDESELSELDDEADEEDNGELVKEEEEPRPMFPGLAPSVEPRDASRTPGGVSGDESDVEMADGGGEAGGAGVGGSNGDGANGVDGTASM